MNGNEKRVREKHEGEGWEVFHSGAPDFLMFKRENGGKIGKVKFVEVKVKPDHLSGKQLLWKEALEAIGADYEVEFVQRKGKLIDTRSKVIEDIKNLCKKLKLDEKIQERTIEMLNLINCSGKHPRATAGAIVCAASISYDGNVTYRKVGDIVSISETTIRKYFHLILDEIGAPTLGTLREKYPNVRKFRWMRLNEFFKGR